MPILFIAVQCFQCSTMQVKQQKKSGNKWVCAVCNERQSVRTVHARGYLAKDLRKFVQSFNLSRSASDDPQWVPARSDGGDVESRGPPSKRRVDWSEYLDPDADPQQDGDEDDGAELLTELPRGKFRRSFPKCPRRIGGGRGAVKPAFGKRPQSPTCEVDVMTELPREKFESSFLKCPRRSGELEAAASFGKRSQSPTRQGSSVLAKFRRTDAVKAASKWSDYLAKEELDEDGRDPWAEWALDDGNDGFRDRRVEDEVHPDFT